MHMKKIYRKIAKENEVIVAEVKREMQEALDAAYHTALPNTTVSAYQHRVPTQNVIPTVEEFVKYGACMSLKNK